MVGVPEGFEGLLADTVVSCCVHEEHTQEHDVTCDAAGLGVVNFESRLGPDLVLFDIEKVDIVR